MENEKYIFKTDMADERVDEYKRRHNLSDVDGIEIIKEDEDFFAIVTVNVLNENGSKVIDKEIGTYITIECKDINYLEDEEKEKLSEKIKNILTTLIDKNASSIMVVGLGNSKITPDALGNRVTSKLDITRHLFKFAPELIEKNTLEISSICPGVLGTTGIETAEIVESVALKVKPDVIIVIDSLMSKATKRLGRTIQISNKGIVPGAGVENARKGIDEKSLNIPVISIGAPMVVEAATITSDCVEVIKEKLNLKKDEDYTYENIKDILEEKDYNMIVLPKDIDELIDNISSIISEGINKICGKLEKI